MAGAWQEQLYTGDVNYRSQPDTALIPEGQICLDEQQSATTSLLMCHRIDSDAWPSKPAWPFAESMGNFDTGDTSNQGASPAHENEMSWEMENAAMQEGGSPASSRSASPVQLPSDPRKGTYVGLRNQGSTCYLNSLLQCLFFTRELREAILSCNNCDSGIVCQLKKLFQKLLKHDKSAPSTKGITKCLGVRNVHQQQDVVTYFRILMNKIIEETEDIQPLYQVKMVHSITCHGCRQQARIQQNPVLSLALSLDQYTSNCEVYSVHNALDAVQKVNEFTGDEKFYCETCRSKQKATSRYYFETLPQILVLNLKRYQFDGNQFRKLHYEVSVPFSLTLNSEEQPNAQYELFAVCHHKGEIHGGHYVADIKSFENECWYSFDDTMVWKVQEDQNTMDKNSSTAYLLMYRMGNCDAKPRKEPHGPCDTGGLSGNLLATVTSGCQHGGDPKVAGDHCERNAAVPTDGTTSPDDLAGGPTEGTPGIYQGTVGDPTTNPPKSGTYMGLRNQSCTCCLNSLLHCLFFTRELSEAILSCNNVGDSIIVCHLQQLFKELTTGGSSPTTEKITRALGMGNVLDVKECFQLLMDKIIEEKEEIRQLYQLKMVYLITCHGCGHQKTLKEPDLSISLPVLKQNYNWAGNSVDRVLDDMQKEHPYTGDGQHYCECCENQRSTLRYCFETLPQILVIHLKRDHHINAGVSVPLSLTLKTDDLLGTDYELFGMCHHIGAIHGDHYTAEVKSLEDNHWYHFNDREVSEVSEEQISSKVQNSDTVSLLMYRKVNSDAKPVKKSVRADDELCFPRSATESREISDVNQPDFPGANQQDPFNESGFPGNSVCCINEEADTQQKPDSKKEKKLK
ncbi:uncharacterized protein LOC123368295 isoform X2 [Mauremys mutica]|uniref:uncharacterized protein LOC123368295 isoform X2 n=1 Tax=Mauremys mutica TaxID=74926 RepID=UPI001D168B97|nr:uncharacterized protein LOC123368295 isoform X2 [Mauremys mutica]